MKTLIGDHALDDFALELAKHDGLIYNESDSDGSVEAASDMDILEDLGPLQLDSYLENFEDYSITGKDYTQIQQPWRESKKEKKKREE
jgi:hypothetical protein